MKIEYTFANGEKSEVEVSTELGDVIVEIERKEYNIKQKETRRHVSLDTFNADGNLIPDKTNIEEEIETAERLKLLYLAMDKLSAEQRALVNKIFYEDVSASEIARGEGVDKSAISHRLDRALKKLKKLLS
ncbi:hypothetical protein FACS1894105_04160 [Clostridia bacterium]|nr:hypothetical protein FACS1894105_04160 [Clostridia bacterium]